MTIFLHNKYTFTYYRIIARAKERTLDGYKERHHIIPKSLGGTNRSNNLVELTAKEHFICHRLLVKMVDGIFKKKMNYAVWLLCNVKNINQQNRYVPSSNVYQKIRIEHADNVSQKFKGVKKTYSSFAGKTHTEETKKYLSENHYTKDSNWNPMTHNSKRPDIKLRKSIKQKGIPKVKFTCECCGTLIGGKSNYTRWHGQNCKEIQNYQKT
jgi:hypothetical protein